MNVILNEISNFVPREQLENAKIYFYGMGAYFTAFYHKCRLIGCYLDECENVHFVDSNEERVGTFVGKKQIISRQMIDKNQAIVFVSTSYKYFADISNSLMQCGLTIGKNIFYIQILDLFVSEKLLKPSLKLQNSQLGKECFIVGTGPSLKARDLDILYQQNITTFSMNGISKIFNKTHWRPNYIVVQDGTVALSLKEMYDSQFHYLLNWGNGFEQIPAVNNVYFFGLNGIDMALYCRTTVPSASKFSEDIFSVTSGFTTTYTALQLASYMGFKKIYLLGIDNAWKSEFNADHHIYQNEITRNHFIEDYNKHTNYLNNHPNISYPLNFAYECAKKYADEHGIQILNATRGGKLEAFERVNFDDIFKGDIK